jgi:3-oxoacyl-[acyl-carrier-protein] synthase I
MRDVFVVSDNIVSPLGLTSSANFSRLKEGNSGIRLQHRPALWGLPFYASLMESTHLLSPDRQQVAEFSPFEQILVTSIEDVLLRAGHDARDPGTVLIISSTKGNIGLLDSHPLSSDQTSQRVSLAVSADRIAQHFHFATRPLVVSHACISGLLGLITATRLLQSGTFDHAVVAGADLISKFILSGFQSFQAISPEPCRPFDLERNGITLGEAAATILLSTNRKKPGLSIQVLAGSVSNDANHISGPSRTGEELYEAIRQALEDAGLDAKEIDFISAHGTATVYNDDMEAKAFHRAGMQATPVNSLKGYYGHTLGAAGLVESIASIHSLKENLILPTLGCSNPGTSEQLDICQTLRQGEISKCLKTASGFGGCNAALVLAKG